MLERGLGCTLIKSTLYRETQEGWEFEGGGNKGAMGDKGDSLQAT